MVEELNEQVMQPRKLTHKPKRGHAETKLASPKRVQPVAREVVNSAEGETLIIDVTIQTDLGRGFAVGAVIAVDWVARTDAE